MKYKLNIIYINGWSVDNHLTVSTSFPSLKVISKSEIVSAITFVTPEAHVCNLAINFNKVSHIGIAVCMKPVGFRAYLARELKFFLGLLKVCKDKKVDLIIARGAPVGGRAAWLASIIKVPFIVESFEPHSQYMRDSKVWGLFDPRYILQKLWEYSAKRSATALLTVSKNYANHLIENGVDSKKIFVMPCTVDIERFKFDINERIRIRQDLKIPLGATVGICVGKFGGIYFDLSEAIQIFSSAFDEIENFHLLILSNEPKENINAAFKINDFKINPHRVQVLSVDHSLVSGYLSASDFGYALIKKGPSKLYCSPTKVGEYWANGLPVVIPKGIGDDSQIIFESRLGVIIDEINQWKYSKSLLKIIKDKSHRGNILKLAIHNRSSKIINNVYKELGF